MLIHGGQFNSGDGAEHRHLRGQLARPDMAREAPQNDSAISMGLFGSVFLSFELQLLFLDPGL